MTASPATTSTAWTNWAGQQHCTPAVVATPRSERELLAAIEEAGDAGRTVRAVGSGHSFTDACVTDGTHVDLRHLAQLVDADPATGIVRVQAGMPLHQLGPALHEYGLALENQGDIDRQTLAGALATATHGTGERFRNLSANVVGCRLVLADGTVRELRADREADADLLRAARVSIGALGVITELTLRTVPSFRLRKVEEPRPLAEVLDRFDELAATHDHYEFYAFPYSETALSIASDRTQDAPAPLPAWRRWLADDLVANRGLAAFSHAGRRLPTRAPQITRTMTRLLSRDERTDHSHRVFASERRVRFTEMEYAIPRAALRETLEAVLAMIERERIAVTFPIEVRATAPDDAFLSTAAGRDTAYIAVHQFAPMPYEAYFRKVESIMDGVGGRPHWGKRHFQTAETLAPRYPDWDRFQAARAELDPHGLFTNDYVRRTLGPPPSPSR
ncbi:MAG: D-arabinono-1,4-lactone oxidase [Solirubrobacteraceae bacterium]|nr:D-arabinono-1,4-lactone oxidase [Patulibacter sp.]